MARPTVALEPERERVARQGEVVWQWLRVQCPARVLALVSGPVQGQAHVPALAGGPDRTLDQICLVSHPRAQAFHAFSGSGRRAGERWHRPPVVAVMVALLLAVV